VLDAGCDAPCSSTSNTLEKCCSATNVTPVRRLLYKALATDAREGLLGLMRIQRSFPNGLMAPLAVAHAAATVVIRKNDGGVIGT
jgi:hypothetical protein